MASGMEMMIKALGIDPEQIQQQVTQFQTAFENINNSLVSINNELKEQREILETLRPVVRQEAGELENAD